MDTSISATGSGVLIACCSVCQDTFHNSSIMSALNPCGHTFHHECIQRWLQTNASASLKTCPQCRVKTQLNKVLRLYLDVRGDSQIMPDTITASQVARMECSCYIRIGELQEHLSAQKAIAQAASTECSAVKTKLEVQLCEMEGMKATMSTQQKKWATEKQNLMAEIEVFRRERREMQRAQEEAQRLREEFKSLSKLRKLLQDSKCEADDLMSQYQAGDVALLCRLLAAARHHVDDLRKDKKTLQNELERRQKLLLATHRRKAEKGMKDASDFERLASPPGPCPQSPLPSKRLALPMSESPEEQQEEEEEDETSNVHEDSLKSPVFHSSFRRSISDAWAQDAFRENKRPSWEFSSRDSADMNKHSEVLNVTPGAGQGQSSFGDSWKDAVRPFAVPRVQSSAVPSAKSSQFMSLNLLRNHREKMAVQSGPSYNGLGGRVPAAVLPSAGPLRVVFTDSKKKSATKKTRKPMSSAHIPLNEFISSSKSSN